LVFGSVVRHTRERLASSGSTMTVGGAVDDYVALGLVLAQIAFLAHAAGVHFAKKFVCFTGRRNRA